MGLLGGAFVEDLILRELKQILTLHLIGLKVVDPELPTMAKVPSNVGFVLAGNRNFHGKYWR